MPWIYIAIASLFEIGWAITLKYSEGFTKIVPSIITIISMILSFWFLSQGLRTLPIGTAYTVWTGLGAVGTVILGVIVFKEPIEIRRFFCIGLILAGVIGLKLTSAH